MRYRENLPSRLSVTLDTSQLLETSTVYRGRKKECVFANTKEPASKIIHLRCEFLRLCTQCVVPEEEAALHLQMVSHSLNSKQACILQTFIIGSLNCGLNFEKFSQVNQELFLTLTVSEQRVLLLQLQCTLL